MNQLYSKEILTIHMIGCNCYLRFSVCATLKMPKINKIGKNNKGIIVEYKHWFFGHYHFDRRISGKKTCLYNSIVELDK